MITHDDEQVFYAEICHAYIVALGTTTTTRITGEIDYGDPGYAKRLATYIQRDLIDPSRATSSRQLSIVTSPLPRPPEFAVPSRIALAAATDTHAMALAYHQY